MTRSAREKLVWASVALAALATAVCVIVDCARHWARWDSPGFTSRIETGGDGS